MGKKTCVIYDSWGTMARALPVAQAGILFQAICAYTFDDTEIEIEDPAVNAMFAMIKKKLDEDLQHYQEKVERMKTNRTDNRNQTDIRQKSDRNLTDITSDSVSDSVSVSVSDSVSPTEIKTPRRTQAGMVEESDLSDPVKEKLIEWLKYKKERREAYKETGLKSLITEVMRHEQESGSIAVINLINECMASGWRGIIWEKLKKSSRSGAFDGNAYLRQMMEEAERDEGRGYKTCDSS